MRYRRKQNDHQLGQDGIRDTDLAAERGVDVASKRFRPLVKFWTAAALISAAIFALVLIRPDLPKLTGRRTLAYRQFFGGGILLTANTTISRLDVTPEVPRPQAEALVKAAQSVERTNSNNPGVLVGVGIREDREKQKIESSALIFKGGLKGTKKGQVNMISLAQSENSLIDQWEARVAANVAKLSTLPPIPKRFHLTWKDKSVVSANLTVLTNGVQNLIEMNPDWTLEISDDSDVDEYLREKLGTDDWERIRPCHIVEKTDLWRLLKMFHEGGYYQDLDRSVNIPMRAVINNTTKMALPTHHDTNFAQDVMLSAPSNPIFKEAIKINLERRKAGGFDILKKGPYAYLLAVTNFLLAPDKGMDKAKAIEIQCLRNLLQKSPYVVTMEESWEDEDLLVNAAENNKSRRLKLAAAGYAVAQKRGGRGTAKDLYKESKVKHWADRYGDNRNIKRL